MPHIALRTAGAIAPMSLVPPEGGVPAGLLLTYLVQLGVAAAILLVLIWLGRVLWRELMLRTVTRRLPEQADELRRTARKVPLMLGPRPPKDPTDRSVRTVVLPHGDGRPGEAFWGPAPARLGTEFATDGTRQDAVLELDHGVHMLVVCLGRIGSLKGDGVVLDAPARAERARRTIEAPVVSSGPVDQVPMRAGRGWRTTFAFPGGTMLTDTHVDHEGWAFAIGVLSRSGHGRAVELLDAILETWQWLPHGESGGTPQRPMEQT